MTNALLCFVIGTLWFVITQQNPTESNAKGAHFLIGVLFYGFGIFLAVRSLL